MVKFICRPNGLSNYRLCVISLNLIEARSQNTVTA